MPAQAHQEPKSEVMVRRPAGGLNDAVNLDQASVEDASVSTNVVYDRAAIEKRTGRAQIGQTLTTHTRCNFLFHYRKKDGTTKLVGVFDAGSGTGYLYWLDPADTSGSADGTWKGVISGATPATSADAFCDGARLGTAVQYAQRIHYCDGGTLKKMFDGSEIQDFGILTSTLAAPTFEGEVLTGGNLLGNMTYKCKYSYRDPDTGFTSNPSTASAGLLTTTGANTRRIHVKIPANSEWQEDYSTIRLYRTVGDGSTYLFDHDVTGIERLDTLDHMVGFLEKADGDLGAAAPSDQSPIPTAKYIVAFGNRMIAAGDPNAPSTFYYSNDLDPGAWPAANAQAVEDNDGNPITGLFVMLGRLYILKQSGIYMATPTSTEAGIAWRVDTITRDFGCISHHSIVVYNATAYWLDTKGAVEFNGTTPTNISDPRIRDTFTTFAGSTSFAEAYGIHDRQADKQYIRWKVTHPTDGYSRHLIYDVPNRSWTIEDPGDHAGDSSGRKDRVFTLVKDTAGRFWVYSGDSSGRVFRLRTNASGTTLWADNGVAYTMDWRSPWFGDGRGKHVPHYIDFELEASPSGASTGNLTVSLYMDGETTAERSATYALFTQAAGTDPKTKVFRFNCPVAECRRFQVGFSHSSTAGSVKILRYWVVYAVDGQRVIGS